jgi:glutathione peroxidase
MKRLNTLTAVLAAGAVTMLAAATSSILDIPLKDIDGKDTSLKKYKGKVVLVVNVASKCGLTPQYEQLEAIHKKYKAQGFTVIGFPCNDFKEQEPGTAEEIKTFCSTKYNVTFPLMAKLHVKGPEQHPLYTALTGKEAKFPGDVAWNFGKFLVGRDGTVLKRFEPKTTPDDPAVIAAIEEALKTK